MGVEAHVVESGALVKLHVFAEDVVISEFHDVDLVVVVIAAAAQEIGVAVKVELISDNFEFADSEAFGPGVDDGAVLVAQNDVGEIEVRRFRGPKLAVFDRNVETERLCETVLREGRGVGLECLTRDDGSVEILDLDLDRRETFDRALRGVVDFRDELERFGEFFAPHGREFVVVKGLREPFIIDRLNVNADIGGTVGEVSARPNVVDVDVGSRFKFDVAIETADAFVGVEKTASGRDVVSYKGGDFGVFTRFEEIGDVKFSRAAVRFDERRAFAVDPESRLR